MAFNERSPRGMTLQDGIAPDSGTLSFLNNSGEMAALIRSYDWSSTPLGPIENWPQSLRTITGFLIQSPVAIVLLWGPDGIMIYNDGYSVFAGGRHPSLLGSKVLEGWPEVVDLNTRVMETGMAGGTLAYKDLELTLSRYGSAEKLWVDVDYSPVMDESGKPGGVIAIVTETTERVRSEAALRESEARLRFLDSLGKETSSLVDAGAVLTTTTRMVGEHLGVAICAYADMDENEDGFTILGDWHAPGSSSIAGHYHLADFGTLAVQNLRAGLPLIVSDNLRELEPEEAATFQAIGISATICMPLVKNGRLTSLMAIHHKEPHVWTPYELSMIREVTERSWAYIERVSAEADLRASEANLRALNADLERQVIERSRERGLLWALSEDMLARADYQGRMSAVNPAWTKVLGWSEQELLATPYADIIHPDNIDAVLEALREMGRTGHSTRFENRIRTSDGEWKPIGWTVAPEPSGGNFIAVGRDLTEEKAREQELQSAQEALRQAQKMEAIGQLTGGIAHDFNNLLAGISGSLELLDNRLKQGRIVGTERYIGMAQESARRAASLTQRLLAFSRRQTLDPKPTDVNKLIAGMEELIRRTVGPGIELEVVGAAGLWLTRIDPSQLENAILNLSINARDAMPEGGRITIETANKWMDDRAARDRDLIPGQYISVCVTDTGTGMTPDVIAQAFDPFFTTKPLGQGTGLGLSMIHGFVRQSGGQVRIYSEVGKGTTMCLYFPRFAGDLDDTEMLETPHPADAGHGETVLVIDDEVAVRMLMVEVLEEAGYIVLEAGDGPSGLRILQTDVRVDLLVTDVGLPGGMNGRQVADAARSTRPDLKVLFVTGYAENAAVGNGLLAAGMHVIAKPFVMAAFSNKVREMIES